MKGNIAVRLLTFMVLLSLVIAHFVGQVDLLTPSWLWLTAFAGLMGFQATFTGFCPGSLLRMSKRGQCCGSEKTSAEKKAEDSSCCSGGKCAEDKK